MGNVSQNFLIPQGRQECLRGDEFPFSFSVSSDMGGDFDSKMRMARAW
jgi:hypothetical protein